MPGIDGSDQSSISYAPHMYVLREGGDYANDADYIYVGNATVYYDDTREYGDVPVSKLSRGVTFSAYHIGVSIVEGLVGEVRTKRMKQGFDETVAGSLRGIPASEIPEPARKELIAVGIRELPTMSGQTILSGLGIEFPTDIEPIDFAKLFNGSPEEQAAEAAKKGLWRATENRLRETFGIE